MYSLSSPSADRASQGLPAGAARHVPPPRDSALAPDSAPPDLGKAAASIEAMPEPMRRELRELGLL